MKFIIAIIATVIIFSGCTNKNAEPSPSAPTETHAHEKTAEPTVEPSPEPTAAPEKRTRISRAVTTLLDKSENRLKNIHLAANSVNACILAPGETFSFNKIVGARTAERGYLPAAVIIEGEKGEDYGGGVCQLATTIYQAAKGAELKIIERHNHQKDVGYTALGTDAAVNYGSLDMKFQNTKDFPVMVAVLVGDNSVIAEIFKMNY